MTDQRKMAADLERVQLSLSRLPRRAANPEFRDRLRSQFVRDAIPERVRNVPHTWWSTRWGIAAMAASSAAAILAFAWVLNPGPAWKLTGSSGSGMVQIDGRPTPLDAPAEIASRLHSGADVLLPADAQLDLRLPGMAVIQLVGGSHARMPGRPGRWFARSIVASLDAGEIRISTGPGFRATRLEVVTPEARAIVTGTTLAVLRQADASCVCVLEGRVSMIHDSSAATVYAGFRRSVFRDGSTPRVEPIRPMETMKLTMLRTQAEQALGH
jgi:ferric-dicitrate binding protein FerR (iron transport regulator)